MCKLVPITKRITHCISNRLVSRGLLTEEGTEEPADSSNQVNEIFEPMNEPKEAATNQPISGGTTTMANPEETNSTEKAKKDAIKEFETIKLQIKGPDPFKKNKDTNEDNQKKTYCSINKAWQIPLVFTLDHHASMTVPVIEQKDWKDPICPNKPGF